MSTNAFDTPDWQRSAIVPFANLAAIGHVGQTQDSAVTVPIGGGLAGIVGTYSCQTVNATVSITSLPSNTVIFSQSLQDGKVHTFKVTLDQLVAGDTQLTFDAHASGASAVASLIAYAITETAFVYGDKRFPVPVTLAFPDQGGQVAQSIKVVNIQINGGSSVANLLPAVAGSAYYVWSITVGLTTTYSAAGDYMEFQDTAGNGFVGLVTETQVSQHFNLGGLPIGGSGSGLGIQIKNFAASALTLHGTLVYTLLSASAGAG